MILLSMVTFMLAAISADRQALPCNTAGRGKLVPTWIEPSGETRPLRAEPGEYVELGKAERR
jgi:hypothetical protein